MLSTPSSGDIKLQTMAFLATLHQQVVLGCARRESVTHLGDGLLDLDDLASASATDPTGRGLLAAALRAEESGGTDDSSCFFRENADVVSVSMLFLHQNKKACSQPTDPILSHYPVECDHCSNILSCESIDVRRAVAPPPKERYSIGEPSADITAEPHEKCAKQRLRPDAIMDLASLLRPDLHGDIGWVLARCICFLCANCPCWSVSLFCCPASPLYALQWRFD